MRVPRAGLLPPTPRKAQINPGLSLWLDEKRGSRQGELTARVRAEVGGESAFASCLVCPPALLKSVWRHKPSTGLGSRAKSHRLRTAKLPGLSSPSPACQPIGASLPPPNPPIALSPLPVASEAKLDLEMLGEYGQPDQSREYKPKAFLIGWLACPAPPDHRRRRFRQDQHPGPPRRAPNRQRGRSQAHPAYDVLAPRRRRDDPARGAHRTSGDGREGCGAHPINGLAAAL